MEEERWVELPNEILSQIFSYLDLKELSLLSEVTPIFQEFVSPIINSKLQEKIENYLHLVSINKDDYLEQQLILKRAYGYMNGCKLFLFDEIANTKLFETIQNKLHFFDLKQQKIEKINLSKINITSNDILSQIDKGLKESLVEVISEQRIHGEKSAYCESILKFRLKSPSFPPEFNYFGEKERDENFQLSDKNIKRKRGEEEKINENTPKKRQKLGKYEEKEVFMIELNGDDDDDDIELTIQFTFGYFPSNIKDFTAKSLCVLISSNSLRLIKYLKNPDIDIISYPFQNDNNKIEEKEINVKNDVISDEENQKKLVGKKNQKKSTKNVKKPPKTVMKMTNNVNEFTNYVNLFPYKGSKKKSKKENFTKEEEKIFAEKSKKRFKKEDITKDMFIFHSREEERENSIQEKYVVVPVYNLIQSSNQLFNPLLTRKFLSLFLQANLSYDQKFTNNGKNPNFDPMKENSDQKLDQYNQRIKEMIKLISEIETLNIYQLLFNLNIFKMDQDSYSILPIDILIDQIFPTLIPNKENENEKPNLVQNLINFYFKRNINFINNYFEKFFGEFLKNDKEIYRGFWEIFLFNFWEVKRKNINDKFDKFDKEKNNDKISSSFSISSVLKYLYYYRLLFYFLFYF